MRNPISLVTAIVVFGTFLSACGGPNSGYLKEAGAGLDEGGFGNPTMTNHLLNTGQISAQERLGQRFANEVVPMVNFAFNSAALDGEAQNILRRQATWIRQFPEIRFRVYGHTDLVGSPGYNKRLGLRRAHAVVRYLAGQGISRKRLEAVASFGETRPVVETPNPDRRNRRTVTEVSGFVKSAPLVLDGKYAALSQREYVRTAIRNDTNKQAITPPQPAQ